MGTRHLYDARRGSHARAAARRGRGPGRGAPGGGRRSVRRTGQSRSSPRTACPARPPSEWDVSGAGDPSIQGFATEISVNAARRSTSRSTTDATAYRIDIYRIGYYGGVGARHVATVEPERDAAADQPACLTDPTTGLVDCGNWAESASWAVPADAVSGVYIARLHARRHRRREPHLFVVRDDASHSDLLFQTSDTTWQAYNSYGGNSLYAGGRAPTRAARTRSATTGRSPRAVARPRTPFFNAEYPMVRWLEANGYDVIYIARRRHRPLRRRLLAAAQGVHVGRPRRVLVGAASARTSKRRATPA